jgi:hypothetical protein
VKASKVIRRVIVCAFAGLLAAGCGTTQAHSAAWKAGNHWASTYKMQFQQYSQPASAWCGTNALYNAAAASYNTSKLRGQWVAGCTAAVSK